jgi:hypothetical protein
LRGAGPLSAKRSEASAVLKLAICLAVNRLLFFVAILAVIHLCSSPTSQAGGPLGEWFDASFEAINHALR